MKKPKYDVWIKREHTFTAKIQANTFEEALETAKLMSIDDLLGAPGETVDSEHEITGILKA
jgi:hypothetical protein